jgi:mono/diheme cytochrome c family protein
MGLGTRGTSWSLRLGADLTRDHLLWGDGSYRSIRQIINEGVPSPKAHAGVMPPKGDAQLTDQQVEALAASVYALHRANRQP